MDGAGFWGAGAGDVAVAEMVKVRALLEPAGVVTITSPVSDPAGTVTTMMLSLQLPMGVATP